jgi:phosphate-selective porin
VITLIVQNEEERKMMKTAKSGTSSARRMLFIGLGLIFLASYLAGETKDVFLSVGQPLKLSGFSQFQYAFREKGVDGFSIKRARATLSGDVTDRIQYKIQVDATKSPILIDVQAEYRFSPKAILRAGQFKLPFSMENLISSSSLDTINRSQTVEKLCPGRESGSQGRDIGIMFTGSAAKLEYAIGVFNGAGINKLDTDERKDFSGRLVFSPLKSLSLAGSFYLGKQAATAGAVPRKDRLGLEVFYRAGSGHFKAEAIFAKDGSVSRQGAYAQAGYFLSAKKLQAIAKFDYLDMDTGLKADTFRIATLGLNWFFSEKSKVQVNYEHHRPVGGEKAKNYLLAQLQAGF